MTKYQLAKLIQFVGNLETRKRMQKVVYLLQSAGCPFGRIFSCIDLGRIHKTLLG